MSILLVLNNITFEIRNFNNDFILLQSSSLNSLGGIAKAILDRKFDFIDEVIAAEKEIYLKLNSNYKESSLKELASISFEKNKTKRQINLPVYFDIDGDWAVIMQLKKMEKESYLEKLLEQEFSIAMFGFLPGFVYMNGLSTELHVPRKKIASKYIPENSLAVGGQYLGIYSLPSPGGWHVIGEIIIPILDWQNLPPVQLHPNDEIKIVSIDRKEADYIKQHSISILDYNGFT